MILITLKVLHAVNNEYSPKSIELFA